MSDPYSAIRDHMPSGQTPGVTRPRPPSSGGEADLGPATRSLGLWARGPDLVDGENPSVCTTGGVDPRWQATVVFRNLDDLADRLARGEVSAPAPAPWNNYRIREGELVYLALNAHGAPGM